jgi:hypothetical protein
MIGVAAVWILILLGRRWLHARPGARERITRNFDAGWNMC